MVELQDPEDFRERALTRLLGTREVCGELHCIATLYSLRQARQLAQLAGVHVSPVAMTVMSTRATAVDEQIRQ